jgi:hypothetical protein
LDQNYRRCVACERRAQYLQDPEHHGVLRENIVGEREELQEDLDLVRKHSSSISLKRSRDIESLFKRGAAFVGMCANKQ